MTHACAICCRILEMELDKRTLAWESAVAAKEACTAQVGNRRRGNRECTAQLAALHEQRCRVVSAQLRHSTETMVQATEANKSAQVNKTSGNNTTKESRINFMVSPVYLLISRRFVI